MNQEIIEHNIKLAKKYMVESIYRAANIEGIGVTLPETQIICDGMSVSGHSVESINAVVDLKRAWQWIFENATHSVDIEAVKTINRILGKYTVINAGQIRQGYDEPIRVTLKDGKYYYPPVIDDMGMVIRELESITAGYDYIDNTVELFCYLCKKQLFNDGNKRTATLVANLYMIGQGIGIISIPEEFKLRFYDELTDYYGNDDYKESLKDFLKAECMTLTKYGMELKAEVSSYDIAPKGARL